MNLADKPLVWQHGQIKAPPFSPEARLEAGYLLRTLQQGELLALPHSRPMTIIGPRCHELKIVDRDLTWRIVYRTDHDAIVVAEVFSKKTKEMPKRVIETCKARLKAYDDTTRESHE